METGILRAGYATEFYFLRIIQSGKGLDFLVQHFITPQGSLVFRLKPGNMIK